MGYQAVAEYLGGVEFEVTSRGHKLVTDQPLENKGFDEGMTPPELLLASLASCAGHYAAEYLRKMQLPSEKLRITVNASKAKNPPRLDVITIDIDAGALPPEHAAGVSKAVHACLIHNTLLHPPRLELNVAVAEPAAV